MSEPPMTVRFTAEEQEFLRALAAWWCSTGRIDKPGKAVALRKMLRMVKPPSEDSKLAAELRRAYETMLSAD